MGLFGKMFGGGVKVRVQAPSSVPSDQVIPVSVTITSDKTINVNMVKVEIKSQAKEQGISFGGAGGGVGVQEGRTMEQTVAVVENRETFAVNSGEDKTLIMQLYINGNGNSNNLTGAAMPGALGGALSAVAKFASSIDHVNYIYSVHATVIIQGKKLHAHDSQPIQLLPAQNPVIEQPMNMQAPAEPSVNQAVPQQQTPPQPPVTSPINPMPFANPQPQAPIQPQPPLEQPSQPDNLNYPQNFQ